MAGIDWSAWVEATDRLAAVAERRGLVEVTVAGHGVSIGFKRLPLGMGEPPAIDGVAQQGLEALAARIMRGEDAVGDDTE